MGLVGRASRDAVSSVFMMAALGAGILVASPASAQDKPNIVVIMGDDIGVWNVGAYHRGMMAGRTPNLDKLAAEGAIFTDYYAEASCTAGRAAFVTGELPIRTGLTTVGQAGATIGMPAAAPTIATVLKEMGYATGQFGKNHLGDLNPYLPTVHGFDEFFGYLYHLDAMSDPFQPNYPQEMWATVGPRNLLHTWATDTNDPTVDPRWGEVGMQKIVDEGPLAPHPTDGVKYDMETVDDHFLAASLDFMERAKADGKPFFLWLNPTRMHIFTYLSPKYEALRTPENGWSVQEAGMAQLDDIVGSVMAKLDEMGVAENTILVFTTDNGAEVMTWPDGGMTPFRGEKGMATEGGFRAPAIIRWPGHVEPNQVINGVMSAIDWLPTFAAVTPYYAILVSGVLMAALVLFLDLTHVVAISTFALVFNYSITNIAAYKLKNGNKLVNKVMPLLGLATCILLLAFILLASADAWIVGVAFLIAGTIYYVARKKLMPKDEGNVCLGCDKNFKVQQGLKIGKSDAHQSHIVRYVRYPHAHSKEP